MAVIDDAIISSARKSLPVTAVRVTLDVCQRALNSCHGYGEEPLSSQELLDIHKVCPRGATTLIRLAALTKQVKTSHGVRGAIRRGRTAITRRMYQLAKDTIVKKVEFLLSCKYLGLTADESETYSFSAPLAAALQGCSPTFEWANLFIGQADVAIKRDGEGIYSTLTGLIDKAHVDLIKLIVFSTFDGCSTMRSTPLYAGLDANPAGTSLVAQFKRDRRPLLGNLHCLCHLLNLSEKAAFNKAGLWVQQWFDHIKAVFRWFCKSPTRKAQLKELHKTMEMLNDVITWRMIYPKYYCPTRWIGIARCLRSILEAEKLLEEYTDKLVEDGWLPDRRDDDELPDLVDAADSRLDEDGDDDDGDDTRYHADTFHKWGNNYWHLPITSINDYVDILSEAERLELDTGGRASQWKELQSGTNYKNRCKLLSERVGLTAQMLGIDAIMLDALTPYKVLVERLQTQIVPIGHRVRHWISAMFRQLDHSFLSDEPSYGPYFQAWKERADATPELTNQIEVMGRRYVYYFLKDTKYRLRPYWKFILASETINPCAPATIAPSAWEGVQDLCRRASLSADKTRKVIDELKQQHDEAAEWNRAKDRFCKSNLLRFYRDRLETDGGTKYGNANVFAQIVFSIYYVSSAIETYFSKTRYIKNKHRSRMSDELSSATLHLQQLRVLIHAEQLQPSDSMMIDLERAINYLESSLDNLRRKYVDKRIVKNFDEGDGTVRQYSGCISSVDWSRTDGTHLFHVVYDSDSDEEDMELWEVKKYIRDD